jgi:D-hydroxyproline dehydrogenase subunit beta
MAMIRAFESPMKTADVIVIGAGIVGACCAHYLSQAGLRVAIIDRGNVASGTTGAGEGNILVSDKEPGPELQLALLARKLWFDLIEEFGVVAEIEPKGGVVVAGTQDSLERLHSLAEAQRDSGVIAQRVAANEIQDLEPHIAPDLAGGVYYPQDMQTQPMLAAAHLIARGVASGMIDRITATEVLGFLQGSDGALIGVRTRHGEVHSPWVVNAAGTWSGDIAALAGVHLPIHPRRGFILVTEPLPPMVHHKVYSAEYVANVASDHEGLETSAVIEGTRGGTVLIGSSRERVGFDRTLDWRVVNRLVAQAIHIFPFLRHVQLLRTYGGFRPYCPDHVPVIGPDPRVPGLVHASGHEGAGVGLATATGQLIAQAVTGSPTDIPLEPFRPERFEVEHV